MVIYIYIYFKVNPSYNKSAASVVGEVAVLMTGLFMCSSDILTGWMDHGSRHLQFMQHGYIFNDCL